MLLLGERPTYVDQLTDRLKKLSNKLFEDLPSGEITTIASSSDLYELESREHLFFVRHGSISGFSENRLCIHYESGDLIGLTDCYQLPSFVIQQPCSRV